MIGLKQWLISLADKEREWREKTHPRKDGFELETGVGKNGVWTGEFSAGLKLLQKYFPKQNRVLPANLAELEAKFGPIKWHKITIKPVMTRRGESFDGLRTDITVDGKLEVSPHHPIQYRYMQGPSGYSGVRLFRYNNSDLKRMSTMNVNARGINHHRSRDYFNRSEHE